MYRTDKQFMKNPATASSRIYVGNISEPVVAADLEDRFKSYGKILGLVLQRGFGFIQFETDQQAQSAIRNEHGSSFFNRNLNVRQAVDKSQSRFGAPHAGPPGPQRAPSPVAQPIAPPQAASGPPSLMQKRISPPRQEEPAEEMDTGAGEEDGGDKQTDMDIEAQSRFSDVNSDTSDKRRRGHRGGIGRNPPRERDRDRHHDRYPNDFNVRDMPPRDLPSRDFPPRDMPLHFGREDSYRPAPSFVPAPTFVPPPIIDGPDRNDCEIIVVSKLLTEYAEYIEQRLKGVGLVVDLLFPNEDVPIGRVLANISSRGCLYAILIMPQNEEYRSLTLSILHGIPQEHRNMPIEDAIVLITRNFDAYMRGEKTTTGLPGTGLESLTERHPEQLQMLFNLLAENRQITTSQYDRLLKYLQDRRELQGQYEKAEGVEVGTEPEPNSKQAELQSRIMNILNKSADDVPKPVEAPARQPGAPTPLLNDPSVQKALDSLLSGDMFKNN